MDKEIKRLLKLSNIPNFRLLPEEEYKLNEWKKAQKPAKIRKRSSTRKNTELEPNIRLDDLKITNEVKPEEKTENEE